MNILELVAAILIAASTLLVSTSTFLPANKTILKDSLGKTLLRAGFIILIFLAWSGGITSKSFVEYIAILIFHIILQIAAREARRESGNISPRPYSERDK